MLEINNTTKYKINEKRLQLVCDAFLCQYKKTQAEVSLAIVGLARMRSLNRKYRGLDYSTDILSFPAAINSPSLYLGEIVINKDEISKVFKYQAMFMELGLVFKNKKVAEDYLIFFLLIHGLLHLLGYNDKQVKERYQMLVTGRDFLKKVL